MSDIRILGQSAAHASLIIYKTFLQDYITKVFNAINETDEGIIWFICNEEDLYNKFKPKWKPQMHSIAFLDKPRYGMCDYRNKRIWITSATLRAAFFPPTDLGKQRLVEVIIDEFTHIKTQAGHDSEAYEKQKCEYLVEYYNYYRHLRLI